MMWRTMSVRPLAHYHVIDTHFDPQSMASCDVAGIICHMTWCSASARTIVRDVINAYSESAFLEFHGILTHG
jgi:hypothetical protein